jgi:hypothetical protein
MPEGDAEARHHWIWLHARPERMPQPLSLFNQATTDTFDKAYHTVVQRFAHPTRGLDMSDLEVITAMRNVFEGIGKSYLRDPKNAVLRAVSTSFRLYARLPLWAPREGQEECFYPAALLPGIRWMTELQTWWKNAGLGSDNLAVVSARLLVSISSVAYLEASWSVSCPGTLLPGPWAPQVHEGFPPTTVIGMIAIEGPTRSSAPAIEQLGMVRSRLVCPVS